MQFFRLLFDLIRHLGDDSKWQNLAGFVGTPTLYAVLCAIIFCETGLVVMPFLPGDSLLFAIGTMTARNIGLELPLVIGLLLLAAILGDNCNYWLGRRLGPAVFSSESSKLLHKQHLLNAQAFYDHHGGKTIILARFVPIIRTFAPFVAGIGRMNYAKFLAYSITGGAGWVCLCVLAGWYLGSLPFFKAHFELVVLMIVVVSLIPVAIEFLKARKASKTGHDPLVAATTLAEKSEV